MDFKLEIFRRSGSRQLFEEEWVDSKYDSRITSAPKKKKEKKREGSRVQISSRSSTLVRSRPPEEEAIKIM